MRSSVETKYLEDSAWVVKFSLCATQLHILHKQDDLDFWTIISINL